MNATQIEAIEEIKAMKGNRLAYEAESWSDTAESDRFLADVRDQVVEAVEFALEYDSGASLEYLADEVARDSMPVYTLDLWMIFVGLRGWGHELVDGFDSANSAANCVVNQTAYRLADALISGITESAA